MDEFMVSRLRKLLDILGNDTRCRILDLLNARPRFISEISRELEVGQQAILRHLDELENFGLLASFEEEEAEQKRKGRKRKYYEISPKANYRMIISIDKDDLIFDLRTPEMPVHLEKLTKIEVQIQKAQRIPYSMTKLGLYQELMNQLEEEIENLNQARSKAMRLLEILKSEFK
ncbi:MAG TPA: ArsR family transcriptional regulator [Candidatus Deferrimicrobium sp.]|nr:ArsR family transcriptional regulator [Candidatus Deferrimicrobium sp.]